MVVTYGEIARLNRHDPGSELLPVRRAGHENNGKGESVPAYHCRRRHCWGTYRGEHNFACTGCWSELNLRSRRQLHDLINWLNVHPDDEGAKLIRVAFIAIGSRDWEPAPIPERTDEPAGEVHGRVFIGGRRR